MHDVAMIDIQNAVGQFGLSVERASKNHAVLFESDLDEADKYDLGRAWRQDWKAERNATLDNSSSTFIVSSDRHKGAAIFGVTPAHASTGQIWLLQSKSFARDAAKYHGKAWTTRAVAMTHNVIAVFLRSYELVFNFISNRQKRNIRWLQHCRFEFFHRRDIETDMLFFGQGNNVGLFAQNIDLWNAYLGEEIHHL